jgi:hypothetical protein
MFLRNLPLKIPIILVVLLAQSMGWSRMAHATASTEELVFNGELNRSAFEKAAHNDRVVRIESSPGGTGSAAFALADIKHLIIDGPCQSACAWAFVLNENACFTQRAVFSFHAAHDPGTGRRIAAATNYWLALVAPSLRPVLDELKTSSAMIEVTANAMKRHYADRSCGAHNRKLKAVPKIITATASPLRTLAAQPSVTNPTNSTPEQVAPSQPLLVLTRPHSVEPHGPAMMRAMAAVDNAVMINTTIDKLVSQHGSWPPRAREMFEEKSPTREPGDDFTRHVVKLQERDYELDDDAALRIRDAKARSMSPARRRYDA